jgi:DHA3 family macrolide efflux protein-like MFS transporter
MSQKRKMISFQLIAAGQLISILGSAMSNFAIGIWIWKTTGKATPFSIISVAFALSSLLFTPIAGVLVDRWPRKLSLILPAVVSSLMMGFLLILFVSNQIRLPYIYISAFIMGVANSFEFPAFTSLVTVMLPKEQYNKGNSYLSLIESAPGILAPILAGFLMTFMGIPGILAIDIVTFIVVILVILKIQIPNISEKIQKSGYQLREIAREAWEGFQFIGSRKPLLYLLMMWFFLNFFGGFSGVLFTPYILAKTNNNQLFLGTVNGAFGLGGILCAVLLMVWMGPKKKIKGLLSGLLIGYLSTVLFVFCGPLYQFVAMALLGSFGNTFAYTFSQSIWQTKTPILLQGRVFSARKIIAQISGPITMGISGPLVDYVLYPRLKNNPILPLWLGTGKANALAISILFGGILSLTTVIVAITNKKIRNIESVIPDQV